MNAIIAPLVSLVLVCCMVLLIVTVARWFWRLLQTRDGRSNSRTSKNDLPKVSIPRKSSSDRPKIKIPVHFQNTNSSSELKQGKTIPVSANLRDKLLRLVSHDTKLEQRLIDNLQQKYPNNSLDWCYEKAISDLERDRRSNRMFY
jgi:hypothetical protein